MRSIVKNTLAVISCTYALFQVLPAMAVNNSGQIVPAKGNPKVYSSYVDFEHCQPTKEQSSPVFRGGSVGIASGYIGDRTIVSSGTPIKISCPAGSVMTHMTSQTSGGIAALGFGGGQITNNASAVCCPVKFKWDAPEVKA